jgi:hypothetical protein
MFQRHNPQVNLKALLARSYFAATLAQEFSECVPEAGREEAFLASLLQYLGPIAVAYYLPEKYLEIRKLGLESKYSEYSAADLEVLGFRFEDFSSALAEKWALPQYLIRCLNQEDREADSVQRLSRISFDITQSLFSEEASDEDLEIGINTLTKVFDIDEDDVGDLVENSFLKAKKSSELFGVEASALTPRMDLENSDSKRAGLARRLSRKESQSQTTVDRKLRDQNERIPKDREALQFELLHEIGLHIVEKGDLSTLFNLIMEGIQKVIGFDRIILALCNPDRTEIRGRYGFGLQSESLTENFRIPLHESNLFGRCLIVRKPEFVADTRQPGTYALLPSPIQKVLSTRSFVVSPIYSASKEVGLFYADNSSSGREISSNDFRRFELFTLQANLGIGRLKSLTD